MRNTILQQFLQHKVYASKRTKIWNKQLAPYLYSRTKTAYIYNIFEIAKLLQLAGNICYKITAAKKVILFVGTSNLTQQLVVNSALKTNSAYINTKWINGLFTNWTTNLVQINHLKKLEEQQSLMTKNYVLDKKIKHLKYLYEGLKGLTVLPDLVIFTQIKTNTLALKECLTVGIPTIAFVDIQDNIEHVTYPILGNTENYDSVNYLLEFLTDQILLGLA